MTKPLAQGKLDGLCGLYSTINSFDYLYDRLKFDDLERLFKRLIIAKADLFPKALYDGTQIDTVLEWANLAAGIVKAHVEITRPFKYKKFASTSEYFKALATMVKPANAVAIVGLGAPWDHWTVIKDVRGRTVHFHDSYGLATRNVGWFDIKKNPDKTKLVTKETIIITRLD